MINNIMPVKNFIDENYIEVTGKSEMELIPNEIYLQIYLQEKDLPFKYNTDPIDLTPLHIGSYTLS